MAGFFFQTATYELEANNFIPILWLMLFKQENLQWAKYLDDIDCQDKLSPDHLAEYEQDYIESRYAYLVIDQKTALSNLSQQKAHFIHIFGAEYTAVFEHFFHLIEQNYPHYILLRTSGLPLDDGDTDFLIKPLRQIGNIQSESETKKHFFYTLNQHLKTYPDHSYFFHGHDPHSSDHINFLTNNSLLQGQDDKNTIRATGDVIKKSSSSRVLFAIVLIALISLFGWLEKDRVINCLI